MVLCLIFVDDVRPACCLGWYVPAKYVTCDVDSLLDVVPPCRDWNCRGVVHNLWMQVSIAAEGKACEPLTNV